MPHQCVRCNAFYADGADEILSGCTCGGRLFFFIKQSKLEAAQAELQELDLSLDQKKQIEADIYDLMGTDRNDHPVILDIEAIRVLKPGQYELDLVHLFKGEPLVYKLAEGKYVVDLRGKDLSYISGGFAWSTSEDVNGDSCIFYLDDIRFE